MVSSNALAAISSMNRFNAQIAAEIDGTAPFFYLKAADGAYTLVDGFVYAMSGAEVFLRINNDYPAGLYTYKGTLTNADGDFDLQVKLLVQSTLLIFS